MDKAAPNDLGEARTGKKGKRVAYLIAVHHNCEAPSVYAVVAPSAEAALAQLDGLTTDGMRIEVTGSLSRDLARRLRLKAGEMRII